MENLGLATPLVLLGWFFMPFILVICRSSHLSKIIALFDKVIRFYPIFDFINQNNQYEQTKNSTRESKRTLPSRKHQTYVRIYYCMRGIYYYRNPSKHLIMKTAMQELIELLELNTTNEPLPYLIDVIKEVYIQKEKEQIIDAFEQGIEFSFPTNGSHYYNQTYNQNK